MGNLKELNGFDLEAGAEWRVPCGTQRLHIAPKEDGATYNILYPSGTANLDVKVPFAYDGPFPLESSAARPMKIHANGPIHISYIR